MAGLSTISGDLSCSSSLASSQKAITKKNMTSEERLESHQKEEQQQQRGGISGLTSALRVICLDVPLMLIFAAYVATLVITTVNEEYLTPQLKLMEWTDERRETEVTSYHYVCNEKDITATTADELVISYDTNNSNNIQQQQETAVDHMLVHGASMYPNILSNTTADELRTFILEANQKEKGFWVIEGNHRFSFGVKVDHHPSVAKALNEIATHAFFRPVLDQIVGENPAIIEFTAITSEYGAAEQFIHADVLPEGSAAKYARSFMPSYSLFIPLQDTSQAMGATELCPGTQICSNEVEICEKLAFPASGSQDKWPKGWGALVNQQTTHRGTAHYDPNGPERVVFILTFAPRPLFTNDKNDHPMIETRQIGKGGSYSLQYQHYGHTLDDFGNAAVAMREPFRTLRSFGLYKPSNAQWGWDMITVASMRISYGDNGYNRDTLEEFVAEGGFSFLPRWLQADIIPEDYDEDVEPSGGWYSFLVGTLELVEQALAVLNLVVLGGYLLILIIVASVHMAMGEKRQAGVVLGGSLVRLVLTHATVALLAFLYLQSLSQTRWARQIKAGTLYQPYDYARDNEVEQFDGVTLPNKNDVLIGSHLQSNYIASYADILDFNVPGNVKWRSELAHSQGFDTLTPALQDHLCGAMVQWLGQKGGRLLEQKDMGQWKALKGKEAAYFCYKDAMVQNNAFVKAMLREVGHMKSETKFGEWRSSILHRKVIPQYLSFWENRILRIRNDESRDERIVAMAASLPFPLPRRLATYSSKSLALDRNRLIVPSKQVQAPFRGAWMEVGDDVEGRYRSVHNEWYRGILTYTSADRNIYDVAYDDGEEDIGLCRMCCRHFEPFTLHESVEVRLFDDEDDSEEFQHGKIAGVHPTEDLYDVITENGDLVADVPTIDIRRFR